MRIAADGYIDLGDFNRVRTPGLHKEHFDPMPIGEGLAFLFSHTFQGHRCMVRPPSETELSYLKHAVWADSIGERMDLVDRVWRAVTAPITPPHGMQDLWLAQVVRFRDRWVYPIHLNQAMTVVSPPGGDPVSEYRIHRRCTVLDIEQPYSGREIPLDHSDRELVGV